VRVTLENRLMGHGLYLTAFAWTGATDDADDEPRRPPEDGAGIELEYEAVSEATGVTNDEVGAVLRTLLTIADERGWTPGRLEATSLTTDGAVRGRWHVAAAWFDRLGTDLSEVAFSRRVLETVDDGAGERDTD
jgi:hypothetical protein